MQNLYTTKDKYIAITSRGAKCTSNGIIERAGCTPNLMT